jgi:hypothetical protein
MSLSYELEVVKNYQIIIGKIWCVRKFGYVNAISGAVSEY